MMVPGLSAAASEHSGFRAQIAPTRCSCQCHSVNFRSSEETGLPPHAVGNELCQPCYDEFYADWTSLIDNLTGVS